MSLALAGCQSGDPTGKVSDSSSPAPGVAIVGAPNSTLATDIGLMNGTEEVTVGMKTGSALRVFPSTRSGDFEDEQLPPSFGNQYRAKAWESPDRGFGVITYGEDDKEVVVCALYEADQLDASEIDTVVDNYERRLKDIVPRPVVGSRANYWFWEKDNQRLMICAFKNGKGVDLTVAMGDTVPMDAIGASYADAEKAGSRIEAILAANKSPATPNKP